MNPDAPAVVILGALMLLMVGILFAFRTCLKATFNLASAIIKGRDHIAYKPVDPSTIRPVIPKAGQSF